MKIILPLIVSLLISSCQSETKFSMISEDNNHQIEIGEIEKKWNWSGHIDKDNFNIEYLSNFEKRWIRGKSQWLPTFFEFHYLSMSEMDFLPMSYTPEITFQYDKQGWLEYTLTYKLEVGTAIEPPFLFSSPLKYDYLKFRKDLDHLDRSSFQHARFPNMNYDNMSDNHCTINKTYLCKNTEEGLVIKYLGDTEEGVRALNKLSGMGDCDINELNNFTDFIPNEDPSVAVYKRLLSSSQGSEKVRT